jgi:hypothetical protein
MRRSRMIFWAKYQHKGSLQQTSLSVSILGQNRIALLESNHILKEWERHQELEAMFAFDALVKEWDAKTEWEWVDGHYSYQKTGS